jgi:hypothetical protein
MLNPLSARTTSPGWRYLRNPHFSVTCTSDTRLPHPKCYSTLWCSANHKFDGVVVLVIWPSLSLCFQICWPFHENLATQFLKIFLKSTGIVFISWCFSGHSINDLSYIHRCNTWLLNHPPWVMLARNTVYLVYSQPLFLYSSLHLFTTSQYFPSVRCSLSLSPWFPFTFTV